MNAPKITLPDSRPWLTYRRKIVVIVLGLCLGALSLIFTNDMAHQLRQKEQYEVQLWVKAWELSGFMQGYDPMSDFIKKEQNNIPYIITDGNLNVIDHHLVDPKIINNPDRLQETLNDFANKKNITEIQSPYTPVYYLFYGESRLLTMLVWFPVGQILVIIVFALFGYITFRSSKDDEQNRVWIGLAKETAHQLGTPTSSLLGWIEYLRNQPVDQGAVDEMNNDLIRLMKVVDRFSKIGSETVLSPANINEIVGNSVLYFRSRTPKNVTLDYNGLAIAPVQAMVNPALFEWVVENLLKNSLDALQGKGKIDVLITSDDDWIHIDISDTGKGIPKANFKRIFEPGYTTKTRGWGLGLSLSKRIIEAYHKGKIYVVDSEVGKGTTFRISLKKVYS